MRYDHRAADYWRDNFTGAAPGATKVQTTHATPAGPY